MSFFSVLQMLQMLQMLQRPLPVAFGEVKCEE